MSRNRSVRSLVLEAAVIVTSILLAFGIDAWWDGRQQREEVTQSLEVVRRDLVDMEAQLAEFEEFAVGTAVASLDAAAALTGPAAVPVESRAFVEDRLTRAVSRRTMRLPQAGYTDLLNTGALGLIGDRELRDALVSFFESANRSEEIVEKNSTQFNDIMLRDALFRPGLLVPYPGAEAVVELQDRRNDRMLEQMGAGFPTRPARLWRLTPDDPELDALLSALLQNARGGYTAAVIVTDIRRSADVLRSRIETFLAENR